VQFLDFKIVVIIRKAKGRVGVSIFLSERNGAEQKSLWNVQKLQVKTGLPYGFHQLR